jgi:hypothetical protein
MVPATGSPAACADTRVSVPRAAVTVMPAFGAARLLPDAGVIEILTELLAAAAAELDGVLVPAPLPPPSPPEHPAASSPTAAQPAAACASPERYRGLLVLRTAVSLTSGRPGRQIR